MSEDSQIFVIKTTANQERSVAMTLARVAKKEKLDIRAILAPDELKGYVLVEAPKSGIVELAIQTIPHARALLRGGVLQSRKSNISSSQNQWLPESKKGL